jgi:hypothetical protein
MTQISGFYCPCPLLLEELSSFYDLGRSHMLAAAAGLEPTSVRCTRGVK